MINKARKLLEIRVPMGTVFKSLRGNLYFWKGEMKVRKLRIFREGIRKMDIGSWRIREIVRRLKMKGRNRRKRIIIN